MSNKDKTRDRAAILEELKLQQARDRRRSRLMIAGGVTAAVALIAAALIASGLNSSNAGPVAKTSAADSAIVHAVTSVPAAAFDTVGVNGADSALAAIKVLNAPALTAGGLPRVLYVGAEYCPYCATERWPIVIALSRFGPFSDLKTTHSSSTDIYPNTATLSFRAARYRSADLTLNTTELTDNVGHPLQSQTALDARLIASYDVPPYVNSVDQSGAVPFLDIGNQYILAGAQYDPQVLAGLSAAQIASQLATPSSPVAQAVDGAAKVIVAAIDQVLHAAAGPS